MITNKYEETYYCVWKGAAQTQHINEVVEFLKAQTEPVLCATIGKAVFGKKYDKSYASHMGQMLKHLCQGGFVRRIETKGDPVEIEDFDWIADPDENGELPTIKVHDDKGNEYEICNPKYSFRKSRGHWGTVKKTIIPTIRKYIWIEE